jgi:serine/threonine protein kinase
LDFDTESREFIQEELARNPMICHRVRRNNSFPILYQHDFVTADKYWVVEDWEDVATLDQLVEHSEIKTADVPRIARELAKAILALNEAGVVVRCLSPKMVCLREDGSLLLRDFELATFLGPTSSGKLRERQNVYYADEFDLPDVDYRADMYSWAQIVIFCVKGRRPPSRPSPEFFASLPVKKPIRAILSACTELNRDFRKWDTNKKGDFNFAEILDAIKGWSEK